MEKTVDIIESAQTIPLEDLRLVELKNNTEATRSIMLPSWLRKGAAIGASTLALLGGEAPLASTAQADTCFQPTPGVNVCIPDIPPTPSPTTTPDQTPSPSTPDTSPVPATPDNTSTAPEPQPSTPHKPSKKPNHTKQSNNIFDFYSNPFRDVMHNGSLYARRIDEGVDYGGHGRVYALGDAIVTLATKHSSYWANDGGNVVVYRLTDGPAKDESVFVSESCTPKVHRTQRVHRNTVVCYMNGDNSPWIETGWARGGGSDKPLAYPLYKTVPDGSEMAEGVNYSTLMHSLGAPAGNSNPQSVSTNEGKIIGHVSYKLTNLAYLAKFATHHH